jgi:hypothetical protein
LEFEFIVYLMKVNNFLDNALNIYNTFFPFSDYSYQQYSDLINLYQDTQDIKEFLLKISCSEALVYQILKTITLTSSYFFTSKSLPEQEKFSLEFIFLFSISSNDKELQKERVNILRTILANTCKMNSSFQVSVVDLISNLYLIYCISETFLGTSVIFFSFLSDTENLLKEAKFELFYNDFVLNERTAVIEGNEYEQVQYKELLLNYIGKDNATKLFKIFIEFFAGNKLDVESIDEENMQEVILTSVKQRYIVFDHINFDKLIEAIPQIWSVKSNLEFLLSIN